VKRALLEQGACLRSPNQGRQTSLFFMPNRSHHVLLVSVTIPNIPVLHAKEDTLVSYWFQ
jgi:hypothetical protein